MAIEGIDIPRFYEQLIFKTWQVTNLELTIRLERRM
jgi:hypothetical protein